MPAEARRPGRREGKDARLGYNLGVSGAFQRSGAGAGLQDRFIEKHASDRGRGAGVWPANLGLLGLVALLGCGQQYRPVVAAINPVGPAGQPTKYAVAVSSPQASGSNGLLTVVDFSGDSVLATPEVVPLGTALNPNFFALLPSATGNASQAFILNEQNSLSDVPLTSLTTLLTSSVVQTTLPTPPATATCSTTGNPACEPSVSAFTFGASPRIFVPETGLSQVAVLSTASPALQQQISVGANPVYVVGANTTPRAYVISSGTGTTAGQVAAIESSNSTATSTLFSVSATLPVGINPVYGVETADVRRAFILNNGSGTVSVINVTNNALDVANPTIALPPPPGMAQGAPVWADLSTVTNELVVLSQDGTSGNGYLSIVEIPLCNAAAQPTNPSCDPTNPVDGAGFGTVLATVPVGVNPSMVSVLSDGSRAYVANQGNSAAGINGSVSVVNLISGTVTATIPAVSGSAATPANSPASVLGHPNTISATNGTPTGKVYMTAPDSQYMTVIETDTDAVDTQINLQGLGVRVLVTAP